MLVHLDGSTHLYGVVGDPIAQVKSPPRLTRRFAERGQNAVVMPLHVAAPDLEAFLRGAAVTRNFDGMVMTIPHKRAAYPLCRTASPRARFLEAVNLLRRDPGGGWHGEMIDGLSFVGGLRAAGCDPRGRRALLVGAGGAGSAIALGLLDAGVAELSIHSRSTGPRDVLVALLRAAHPDVPVRVGSADPSGHDLVVNASPAGMRADDPLPVEVGRLVPSTFVADIVTAPEVTPLLAAARRLGCPTQTGVGMVDAAVELMLGFFAPPAAAAGMQA